MYEILLSTIRLSAPLLFAAMGGMLSERSGVANIALEALLLFSAFTAAAATSLSGSLAVGVLVGLLAAAVVGAIYGAICIWGRGDQIVIGTALNLLAAGIIPVVGRALFNVTGSTPSLAIDLRFTNPFVFVIFAGGLAFFLHWMFKNTRHGLRISAAGNNPLALSTQGVSFKRVRLLAVIEGSVLVGFGGIYLSLCQSSGYIRNMSAGRGFLALAALIFGGWKPIPTMLACLFFGLTDAVQMQLQGVTFDGKPLPNQFVQILPFVVTLVVLVAFSGKMKAPRAINQDIE